MFFPAGLTPGPCTAPPGKQTNTNFEHTLVDKTTIETQETDQSTASFHLQDPDVGDYFVVSTWYDPDHGTPLFGVNGGASQCSWEVGTAHRSQPTIKAEYLGSDTLGANEAALFKVTVANELDYYSAGAKPGVFRSGWAGSGGYLLPDFDLTVAPTSLADGLTVDGAVGLYLAFGKGSFDVMIQVHRGPRVFKYAPPKLIWNQRCNQSPEMIYPGTDAAVELRHPFGGAEGTITFNEPCPAVAWSGTLDNRQFFSTADNNGDGVLVARAVIPPQETSTRSIKKRILQHRRVYAHGTTKWMDGGDAMTQNANDMSGEFNPKPGGVFDLRVKVTCTETPLDGDTNDYSLTPAIRGVVDTEAAKPASLRLLSGSSRFAAGDTLVVTFTREVVCSGTVSSDGTDKAAGVGGLTVDVGSTKHTQCGQAARAGCFSHSCQGNELSLSIPVFPAKTPANVWDNDEVSVTYDPGAARIYDTAGNAVDGWATNALKLKEQQASKERKVVADKVRCFPR